MVSVSLYSIKIIKKSALIETLIKYLLCYGITCFIKYVMDFIY